MVKDNIAEGCHNKKGKPQHHYTFEWQEQTDKKPHKIRLRPAEAAFIIRLHKYNR